ncbi:TPA: hypothetical protein ACH3X2_006999 [Trebouxia sp. C0005]
MASDSAPALAAAPALASIGEVYQLLIWKQSAPQAGAGQVQTGQGIIEPGRCRRASSEPERQNITSQPVKLLLSPGGSGKSMPWAPFVIPDMALGPGG